MTATPSSNVNINIDLSGLTNLMNQIAERLSRATGPDVLMIIVALVLPPLAVLIKVGLTAQFWLNVLLTFLGVVPGQIHALWIVLFH